MVVINLFPEIDDSRHVEVERCVSEVDEEYGIVLDARTPRPPAVDASSRFTRLAEIKSVNF